MRIIGPKLTVLCSLTENALCSLSFDVIYSILHFRCINAHFMASYTQPSEVCSVLIALHLPFGSQLRALQPQVPQWERKFTLSERTFPSLHKTHSNSTSSHYSSTLIETASILGAAAFFVLSTYDKAKPYACVCETFSDAGCRHIISFML